MKLFSKKFRLTFVPFLIVLFLLIVSAVTSYVVINRGTGGYKTRAGWGIPIPNCELVAGRIPVSCGDGKITGSVNPNLGAPSPTPSKKANGNQCSGNANCISNYCNSGRCGPVPTSTPTPKPSSCAVGVGASCGYLNKAGCPDGVAYCSSGSCDSDNNAKNGIQGPAEGRTGKCVAIVPTDPKPSATPVPNGGGGGGGYIPEEPPAEQPPAVEPPAEVPPTVPPTTTGDVTLAFTLKFQGVTGNPKGSKTVPFKVKLKNATKTTDYVKGTLTADSSGKWTGSVSFSGIELGPNTGYSVYVKVGKHLQKRICVASPTESPVGTYSCSDNTIPLVAGQNTLDFSSILQLVGDLPSSSGEQNGVVDSYDISYVLNNLGSTEQSKLAIGDLNFDGIIDSQDRSLIIQSLNVKYDDE